MDEVPEGVLAQLAAQLWAAQETRQACVPLTAQHRLSAANAYAIQAINRRLRCAHGLIQKGPRRVVGHKVGLTSKAIQSWLKVSQPDYGYLLDEMWLGDRAEVSLKGSLLLQPRVEGEIAFLIDRDLPCGNITAVDVMRATGAVLPCIEVIDSRIADWEITFEDTVADNASSGLFAVGGCPRRLSSVNVVSCGMTLRKNGQVVATGAGAACLGSPVNAVVWLANTLAALRTPIVAGDLVLSGALGPVTDVVPGDVVDLAISGLGSVQLGFSA